MEIRLDRFASDAHSTLGKLIIGGVVECFTLEDEPREIKVPGQTRIPAGRYRLELKPDGTSRFDARARGIIGDDYRGMVRLEDVPGFSEILIHWGNYHTDTAGCILVGKTHGFADGARAVFKSVDAFKALYPKLARAISSGSVWLTISDEPISERATA